MVCATLTNSISIHALLAESDSSPVINHSCMFHFYPRSPCGERHKRYEFGRHNRNFYPRSPCGERPHPVTVFICVINFYPRSPCGERLKTPCVRLSIEVFLSTLSLRRATQWTTWNHPAHAFLSTLSLRRATADMSAAWNRFTHFYPRSPCGERRGNGQNINREHRISIHALLAESDFCLGTRVSGIVYFYPRSPCGERPSPKP